MRDNIVAITSVEAESAARRALKAGGSERDAALAAMEAAREGWLAPSEDEAFMASLSGLIKALPERKDTLLAEAKAIGDRNKMLQALMNGVPVDMEAWAPADFPDDAFGLLALWHGGREPASTTTTAQQSSPKDSDRSVSGGG